MARMVALVYNWWTLFVRLAQPHKHFEAISSRPLLLYAVALQDGQYCDQLATLIAEEVRHAY